LKKRLTLHADVGIATIKAGMTQRGRHCGGLAPRRLDTFWPPTRPRARGSGNAAGVIVRQRRTARPPIP